MKGLIIIIIIPLFIIGLAYSFPIMAFFFSVGFAICIDFLAWRILTDDGYEEFKEGEDD